MRKFSTKFKDLTGLKTGRLTVLRRDGSIQPSRWICECECGAIKSILSSSLIRNKTKSCGCLSIERISMLTFSHGKTGTPTYRSWQAMMTRCTNPNRGCAANYIKRGIRVCDRWMKFENFYKDMGERPNGTTLDRIDSNGNYEPSNCRWATLVEQGNNTRRCRKVTHNGKTQNITQWANEIGVSRFTLFDRLRRNLPPEEILKSDHNGKRISTKKRIQKKIHGR